jgi:hypothetical protein
LIEFFHLTFWNTNCLHFNVVQPVVWVVPRVPLQPIFYCWRVLCWSICANSSLWSCKRYSFLYLNLQWLKSKLNSSFKIFTGIDAGIKPILNFKVCIFNYALSFFVWLILKFRKSIKKLLQLTAAFKIASWIDKCAKVIYQATKVCQKSQFFFIIFL